MVNATLLDGWRSAGSYTLTIQQDVLSRLPAGLYRYELRMGSASTSRVMVLIH